MAYPYYYTDPNQNPYAIRSQQPQQQGMGGINPMQGLQMYQQFAGGGSGGGGFGGMFGGGGATAAGSSAAPTAGAATGGAAAGGTAAGTTGGAGAAGSAAGGASGGAGSMLASAGPYALIVAAIMAKAEDTRKRGGISYKDQLRNVSRAPQSDFDRWGLEKYTGGDIADIYKGSFDVATGDFSNWYKNDPIFKHF